jgi:hypothetical protein
MYHDKVVAFFDYFRRAQPASAFWAAAVSLWKRSGWPTSGEIPIGPNAVIEDDIGFSRDV